MRYVLCRPGGGLTDNLSRIAECYNYAVAHNRLLVVDGEVSTARGFNDCFGRYFTVPGVATITDEFAEELSDEFCGMSIAPWWLGLNEAGKRCVRTLSFLALLPGVRGCIKNTIDYQGSGSPLAYRHRYHERLKNYVDTDSGRLLSFNMGRSYDEQVLLHHQCGGFGSRFEMMKPFLKAARFSAEVRGVLSAKLSVLKKKKPYHAVHVRHTDFNADYKKFMVGLKDQLAGKRVLICSDRELVLPFARECFDTSEVITTGATASSSNTPVHYQKHALTRSTGKSLFDLNVEALLDVMALSGGETLHLAPVVMGKYWRNTGYQNLAKLLHENQDIRKGLMQAQA